MKKFVSVVHGVSDGDSSSLTTSSGMFDVSTWNVDEIGRGPRCALNCGDNTNDVVDDEETVDREHGLKSKRYNGCSFRGILHHICTKESCNVIDCRMW